MDINGFKVVALVLILLTGLGGGFLARWISKARHSEAFFSLGNAFAGGVFLGAGLIHMLPDAQSGFAAIAGGSDFPWFAVVCCLGFLAILFLDNVLVRAAHQDVLATTRTDGTLYSYVLMLILSIHSIITGIALGTESRIAQALVILIAVMAHKGTAAFALGVSLVHGGIARRRMIALIALFSCMTPVGIALGIGCMQLLSGRAAQVFEAGFDALAAGTFLYVAVLGILHKEFAKSSLIGAKFVLVLAGLTVMAIVAVWT